jgi:hypothetical protein
VQYQIGYARKLLIIIIVVFIIIININIIIRETVYINNGLLLFCNIDNTSASVSSDTTLVASSLLTLFLLLFMFKKLPVSKNSCGINFYAVRRRSFFWNISDPLLYNTRVHKTKILERHTTCMVLLTSICITNLINLGHHIGFPPSG